MSSRILTLTAVSTLLLAFGPDAPAGPLHAPLDPPTGAEATTFDVRGRVVDADRGTPIQGAQVFIRDLQVGAVTGADGRYVFSVDDALVGREVTVEVSVIGYTREQRTLTLASGGHTVSFALRGQPLSLDAVVVTGAAEADMRRAPSRTNSLVAAPGIVSGRHAFAGSVHSPPPVDREAYAHISENEWISVDHEPLSTFSIDVDRASYANVRRFIEDGMRPPVDAVRIEELVNYFPYSDPAPEGSDPVSVTAEVAPAPWQPAHHLVRIGLKGREIDMRNAPPSNLVFLLDVSGSMSSPDKLPLLKSALSMLIDELGADDRVAIVVYAGAAGLVLPSTPGSDREVILRALHSLESGGSTAGGAGIRLAYDVAARNYIEGGNNRVILATDGDFNVGASSDSEMVRLIEDKREEGTFLTVLGFGTGNLQDSKMEQIADHGNGNYAYIDGLLEARKVLVQEMGGTLLTIAKDVKIQVEFNPARVASYRLIGYENRLLAAEDFNDDTKDAGELGAGHTVTALYEVVPVGADSPVLARDVDALRYQRDRVRTRVDDNEELLFVKLRYKQPDGDRSRLLTRAVGDVEATPSDDFRFAAAVAAWGMLLRDSEHCDDLSLSDVSRMARGALGDDPGGYRADFVRLVDRARALELLDSESGQR